MHIPSSAGPAPPTTLDDARQTVIDAARHETHLEDSHQDSMRQALCAPVGSPRLRLADDGTTARKAATEARRTAVHTLDELERKDSG